MGARHLGVEVDHLRLDPQPELHAAARHVLDQRSEPLGPDGGVDGPVAQPRGVVAAAEEPPVVEDEPLHPDRGGHVGELGQALERLVEVDRLPRVGDDRPLRAGAGRDRPQVGVEAVAQRVEPGGRPRPEQPRGAVGLAGGEHHLAGGEQLAAAEQAVALGGALGVRRVVAAPGGVHGPGLAGAEGEAGGAGDHEEGGVVARPSVAGVAAVRALHPRVPLGRALLAPASGEVEQLARVRRDRQRGEDGGEVEVAVGRVGDRRTRVEQAAVVEGELDGDVPAGLRVARGAGERAVAGADLPVDQAGRRRGGRATDPVALQGGGAGEAARAVGDEAGGARDGRTTSARRPASGRRASAASASSSRSPSAAPQCRTDGIPASSRPSTRLTPARLRCTTVMRPRPRRGRRSGRRRPARRRGRPARRWPGRGGRSRSPAPRPPRAAAMLLSPTTPHLLESTQTISRRERSIMARLVSDSRRLGVLKPARTSIPCTPMKKASTWRLRSDDTATGPTSASDGVRSPPVSSTEVVGSPVRCRTSATQTELVTTVRSGMRARCPVSACVVVPAETAMAMPGCTSSAAAAAIASFSRRRCTDFAAKPGSDDDGSATASAPPWTFSRRPSRCSATRSRRTVMSETPSSSTRSVTRTVPSRLSSERIRPRRWAASIRRPAPWRRRLADHGDPAGRHPQVARRPRGRRPGRCRARGPPPRPRRG